MGKKTQINESFVLSKIHFIRGQKVILDEDLAVMYGVETKRLNEQVKRNPGRFPKDFMFQLSKKEFENLKSQFATSSSSWGGRRGRPFAFTDYGVLMLSGVLNSETAIQVNLKIIRVYAKLREMLLKNKDILIKLEQMEKKINSQEILAGKHDNEIQLIFRTLKQLISPPPMPRKRIGFKSAILSH
ncbi:MAG: ORF6N domain-containing protein [Bacteroidetes bacterium]|nr:MAG: ORF6N domain-containing protein [Bacteroidota bacterium]